MIDYLQSRGWLTNDERKFLHDAAEQVAADGLIVNIGVEYGASLACLRAGNPTARIVGIDLDVSQDESRASVELIEGDSGTIAAAWTQPIDLLFIDGDHSYEGVKRDTSFCDSVKPGGMILFHDCFACDNPTKTPHVVCAEINKAIDEWIADNAGMYHEYLAVGSMRRFKRV